MRLTWAHKLAAHVTSLKPTHTKLCYWQGKWLRRCGSRCCCASILLWPINLWQWQICSEHRSGWNCVVGIFRAFLLFYPLPVHVVYVICSRMSCRGHRRFCATTFPLAHFVKHGWIIFLNSSAITLREKWKRKCWHAVHSLRLLALAITQPLLESEMRPSPH